MAGITSAIIGGVAGLGSAYSSYRGARAQEEAQRRAQEQIAQGMFQQFGFGNPGGGGPFGSYDPATGSITTGLGDRLQGQLDQTDAFANFFANQAGGNQLGGAFSTLGALGQVAGNQPIGNQGLFSGLQGRAQGALDLAGLGLGASAQDAAALNPLGNQAFGVAGQQLGEIGGFEDVRSRQLDLLRQQAAPFEERQFSNLQDTLFAQGRLGSTGGALQTEAFARGLGQADLSRQLAASGEARNFQQNALGLAQGAFGIGGQQRGLSDSLLSSAFGNFGNIAGLSSDIEQSRFGQSMMGQNNLFSQLQGLMGNQVGLAQAQQGLDSGAFGNFLRALTAGQGISQIPLDRLSTQLGFEQARSNAALGAGSAQLGVQLGQGSDALAAAFSGLSGASQSGGLQGFLGSLGGLFGGGGGAAGAGGGLAAGLGGFFSDRRLKTNIQRVGTVSGYPWYTFDYVWGESSEGVMSDEVPAEYVSKHSSGYDMVDYGRLL